MVKNEHVHFGFAVLKPPQLEYIGEFVDVGQISHSSLPAYTMWPVRLDGCGNLSESDPRGRANTVMFFQETARVGEANGAQFSDDHVRRI